MQKIVLNGKLQRVLLLLITWFVILISLTACGTKDVSQQNNTGDATVIINSENDNDKELGKNTEEMTESQEETARILTYLNRNKQPGEKEISVEDLHDIDIEEIKAEMMKELEEEAKRIEAELAATAK
jgi:hypothetical protein